jgi:16S rRNA processing protein RimM
MDTLLIGKLIKPYGLKGLIKTAFYIDDLKELDVYSHFYIRNKTEASGFQKIVFEKITGEIGSTIVKLEGIEDRNGSELMSGKEIFVDAAEVPELKGGRVFYMKDLFGLEVYENSALMGNIANVIEIADRTMLLVKLPSSRELAVPFNDKYVLEVDIKNRKVIAQNLQELM